MLEPTKSLEIRRIDGRREAIDQALDEIRERLSPRGEVVSEAGKRKTIEVFGEPLSPQQVVDRICREVREEGLPALLRYCEKLDRAVLTQDSLRVSQEQMEAAHRSADPQFLETVRRIRDRVMEFQTAILHRDVVLDQEPGIQLWQRYVPLHRVGICVPGGAAAYPSTVLMTAVPAMAAGVKEIAVVAPPTKFGAENSDVLATCWEIGVREIYRIGGAQAIAALAYGVPPIEKVDKIVGPGNMFVALAKKLVYGDVDIDSIAGPSEVVVIANHTTRADFTAADMLAQAEHAPGASILVTWDEEVLEATYKELERRVATLSRADVTRQSLAAYGALILVRDEEEACRITNLLAPEHLHIAIANAERLVARIHSAGATFLGNFSPVAIGDYAAGPSHVLPTGGTARWASGLTSNDFLRAGSVMTFSEAGLRSIAGDIRRMADKEGLTAHRASVDVRIG